MGNEVPEHSASSVPPRSLKPRNSCLRLASADRSGISPVTLFALRSSTCSCISDAFASARKAGNGPRRPTPHSCRCVREQEPSISLHCGPPQVTPAKL